MWFIAGSFFSKYYLIFHPNVDFDALILILPLAVEIIDIYYINRKQ